MPCINNLSHAIFHLRAIHASDGMVSRRMPTARLFVYFATLGIFLMSANGCHKESTPQKYSNAKPQKQYSRIVSLAPGITEIIFFLGEQHRLVGVTSHCDFPSAAKKITKVGGFGDPSVERILSLHPDLILTSDYKTHPSFSRMKSLDLNVQDLETKSFDDAIELVRIVGEKIGVPKKGRARAAELRTRIERIRRRHINEKTHPRVYVELWYSPITTTGKGSFVSDMISVLGAKNIFGDINKPYPQINSEAVVQRDPEIIIIGYMLEKQNKNAYIKNRPAWNNIAAVRNGRVYSDIQPDLFLRTGPRLVDGLEKFEKKIYGDNK